MQPLYRDHVGSKILPAWVPLALSTGLFCGALLPAAEEPAPTVESQENQRSREELQLSLEQVDAMRLRNLSTNQPLERVKHPVLRFSSPFWGGHHGTVWVWGTRGRPVAVLEMSLLKQEEVWYQSFHSTTEVPFQLDLSSEKSWTPKSSNVTFQPLPNAPEPADQSAGRMRQMKAIARNFSAHQLWTWREGDGSRHELRLMPTPVHRYEDREQQLIDGALFIIAQGTNPEATVFLEAVASIDGAKPFWQFGIGRSSFAELFVNYEDQEVYHDPPVNYEEIFDSKNSYWKTKSPFSASAENSSSPKE